MDINNFNEVVEYINNELMKDRTFKDIESGLGFNDRVLYKRLIRKGYKRSEDGKGLFVLQDVDKGNTKLNKADIKPKKTKVKATNTFSDDDIKIIKQLINRYDDILYMLNRDSVCDTTNIQHIDNINNIDVIQVNDTKQKMFRIDIEVLDRWNKFCEDNKHIKVQSLISSALNEYIDKYGKRY